MTSEVNEAISSLVFAASRCGELSGLTRIRILLRKHFGRDFERVSVELLPGNCVNANLRYRLGNKSLLEEEKLHLINKIAAESNKNLCGKTCSGENNHDPSNSGIINMMLESQDSKVKNMFNRIGTMFRSFNSTHLGTIHCDDNSQTKQEIAAEDGVFEPRLSYVHPKLPDYDNIVDTFTKYKKERLMKSDSKTRTYGKWMRW